jgi:3-oxoacyl-[acyl-carrier-protein] synthase-3
MRSRYPIPLDIEKTTGVRERRVAPESMTVTDMAIKACDLLFSRTRIQPSSIDLVIFTSVSREYLEPATAAVISKRLGINRAKAFDLSNACLGFVDGWMTADAMIQAGRSRLCLIVGSEISSPFWKLGMKALHQGHADPKALLPSFTLGDGAAAMIVGTRLDRKQAIVAHAGVRESFGQYSDLCIVKDHSTPMVTKSKELLGAALKHSPQLLAELLATVGWKPAEVDLIIPHQASLKMIGHGAQLTKLNESKFRVTLDRFGNMASVSVPFTLCEAIENGVLHTAERILILGYGSGLGIGMLAVTVNKSGGKKFAGLTPIRVKKRVGGPALFPGSDYAETPCTAVLISCSGGITPGFSPTQT